MKIRVGQIEWCLEVLKTQMNQILDDRSEVVIEEAKSMLRTSKSHWDNYQQKGWGTRKMQPWGFENFP